VSAFTAALAKGRARKRIAAGPERALQIPSAHGWTLLIHRDTYPGREGCWRLTRFDGAEPFGHTECSSWQGAVTEAGFWGAQYELAVEVGSSR
jgi:hypothetical protein